jgi:hypothetical protein
MDYTITSITTTPQGEYCANKSEHNRPKKKYRLKEWTKTTRIKVGY